MALNHVAQRARGFVKAAAALNAQRFGRCDLHVVHVIPVPERLKDSVAKAQHQQILHRVFAQVMIDAVNLLFIEHVEDNLIERPSRCQITSKGLFNDDAHPRVR